MTDTLSLIERMQRSKFPDDSTAMRRGWNAAKTEDIAIVRELQAQQDARPASPMGLVQALGEIKRQYLFLERSGCAEDALDDAIALVQQHQAEQSQGVPLSQADPISMIHRMAGKPTCPGEVERLNEKYALNAAMRNRGNAPLEMSGGESTEPVAAKAPAIKQTVAEAYRKNSGLGGEWASKGTFCAHDTTQTEAESRAHRARPVEQPNIWERKLIENDGRVYWLHADGSHRGLSAEDVKEINRLRALDHCGIDALKREVPQPVELAGAIEKAARAINPKIAGTPQAYLEIAKVISSMLPMREAAIDEVDRHAALSDMANAIKAAIPDLQTIYDNGKFPLHPSVSLASAAFSALLERFDILKKS